MLIETITWQTHLREEKNKPYFQAILAFLKKERAEGKIIYPAQKDVFNALKYTPYESIRVVILGQDPYHAPKQAHGLAFSVPPKVSYPPSLLNIFKELHSDLGISKPESGCLIPWAKQGVLLLNAVLTVEADKPQSHAHIGWQTFTDTVIQAVNDHQERIVFLLWGSHAQQKKQLINNQKHAILTAAHPSPLSAHRGFLGSKHFSKTNHLLTTWGRQPIDWSLR